MRGSPQKKEDAELVWSQIKRAITARVNFEAQVWRERQLNEQLSAAFEDFMARYNAGELPQPGGLELSEGEES